MTILFKPNGSLNVSTAATDLPQSKDDLLGGKNTVSEALQRCKNMHLDRNGLVRTRDGSTKTTGSATSIRPNLLIEMTGVRYAFGGTLILKDEVELENELTDAQWSGIKYNSCT